MEAIAKKERTLEIVAAEIRTFTASMLNNVIEIGRRFCEAKELSKHGEFGNWIQANTAYSVSTANNFMRLYLEYGDCQGSLFGTEANSQAIGNLSYSKALALLAVPAEDREDFAREVHAEELSVSELKRAIRERDEARQDLQEANQRGKVLEERAEGLRLALSDVQNELIDAKEEAKKAAEAVKVAHEAEAAAKKHGEALARALEELKARPVEVAVEADPEALEAAKREAEEAMRDKLDKAKAAKAKAEQKAKDAEAALKEAQRKLEAAQEASRKAEAGADKDVAAFGVYFQEAQEVSNKLHGLYLKIKGRDAETGAKLAKALQSLSEAIGRCVE